MPDDLRDFLRSLENEAGSSVLRVSREVSPVHEACAVVKRLEETQNFPVVFDHVQGSDIPSVMNLFGDKRRVTAAYGCPADMPLDACVDRFLDLLANPIATEEVSDGPVKEVRLVGDEVDLDTLPITVHSGQDGGRYLSSSVVLARDPDSGAINAGIYRMMVKGKRRLTLAADPSHDLGWIISRSRELGRLVEIAIVLGAHPALYVASQAKHTRSLDSLWVMGALMGSAIPVVRAEMSDLVVPANAEIVLEGTVNPNEHDSEGPFGEFTYAYGSDPAAPVCELAAMTRRAEPLFVDIHPTHREHRTLNLYPGREARLLSQLRAVVPEVRAVHIPLVGAYMFAVISLDKVHDGDAKRVLLLALGNDVYIKHAIVVDPDVDIFDYRSVMGALATRFQPHRDLVYVNDTHGYMEDPSTFDRDQPGYASSLTSKLGYDATMPLGARRFERADVIPEPYTNLDPSDYLDLPAAADHPGRRSPPSDRPADL
jgi:2,5-furandicarboxylate decarboxylase 1